MDGRRVLATISYAAGLVGFFPTAAAGPLSGPRGESVQVTAEGVLRGNECAIQVPRDFPTIQEAVDAAEPGDEIRVGPGEFCGAVLDKEVHLVGHRATIVGCPTPIVNGLRAGFFLPDASASGSSIERFRFDGEGASDADLEPLSFAVFGRSADDVLVERNRIVGTVQAITNTGGSRWQVLDNRIIDLGALTCEPGGRCGGGSGIVFQQRSAGLARAADNIADGNRIRASMPDGLDEFVMAGLFLQGQSGAVAIHNRVAIRENAVAAAFGVGVLVTDTCCGSPDPLPNSVDTQIVGNEGKRSRFAVFVTTANLDGLVVRKNRGQVVVGIELPALGPSSGLAIPGAAAAGPAPFE